MVFALVFDLETINFNREDVLNHSAKYGLFECCYSVTILTTALFILLGFVCYFSWHGKRTVYQHMSAVVKLGLVCLSNLLVSIVINQTSHSVKSKNFCVYYVVQRVLKIHYPDRGTSVIA